MYHLVVDSYLFSEIVGCTRVSYGVYVYIRWLMWIQARMRRVRYGFVSKNLAQVQGEHIFF